MKMGVNLCGVELKNPVIAASGTFGFGREYDEFYDVGGLGGISVKGLTRLPRLGNPPHRITETPAGMLNSVGLQNPGVEAFLEKDLPWLLEKGAVVVANAAGSTEDDYCYMAERLSGTGIHILEMNISCPNVKEGGVAFGTRPESVYKITKAVRAHCTKPLMVKLSPNVADIAEVALAAQEGGADAISLINTLTGMAVDVCTRRPVLANVVGGLSGPAVRPVALRMCWQAAKAVSIPVVGMGGIESGEDAIAFLLVGCTAVQVGTANLHNPYACMDVIRGMEEYGEKYGVQDVRELIGALRLD